MSRPFEILKSAQEVEDFRLWSPPKNGEFKREKKLDASEKAFALLMISLGHSVQHAKSDQDKFEHWDWKVSNKTEKYILVDVKGAKKEFRHDPTHDYGLSYNELQNIKGNDGWLKGKSHKIALVLIDPENYDSNCPNQILCFNTKELRKWTENKIQGKQITPKNKRGVYYEAYQRSDYGKKDICVKSKISDMKNDLKCTEYSLDKSILDMVYSKYA